MGLKYVANGFLVSYYNIDTGKAPRAAYHPDSCAGLQAGPAPRPDGTKVGIPLFIVWFYWNDTILFFSLIIRVCGRVSSLLPYSFDTA
jgi:hypothetical protein